MAGAEFRPVRGGEDTPPPVVIYRDPGVSHGRAYRISASPEAFIRIVKALFKGEPLPEDFVQSSGMDPRYVEMIRSRTPTSPPSSAATPPEEEVPNTITPDLLPLARSLEESLIFFQQSDE